MQPLVPSRLVKTVDFFLPSLVKERPKTETEMAEQAVTAAGRWSRGTTQCRKV